MAEADQTARRRSASPQSNRYVGCGTTLEMSPSRSLAIFVSQGVPMTRNKMFLSAAALATSLMFGGCGNANQTASTQDLGTTQSAIKGGNGNGNGGSNHGNKK